MAKGDKGKKKAAKKPEEVKVEPAAVHETLTEAAAAGAAGLPFLGYEFDSAALRELRRDLRAAATELSKDQARVLVDYYYAVQDFRIQAGNQVLSSEKQEEPHLLLAHVARQQRELEETLKAALGAFAASQDPGRWALSITGIGPVLAAGLLAHIEPDIELQRTAGQLWSFAGLNPDARWDKGQKRPWNARLKVLCWKVGESFVKVQGLESDVYGKVYAERKRLENERNVNGVFADQAARALEERDFGKDTDARAWYEGRLSRASAVTILEAPATERQGMVKRLSGEPGSGVAMLPPARIHLRATRRAVKLFLSHYHHVSFESKYGEAPPHPYVLTSDQHPEHSHFIAPPNWPIAE